MENRRSTFHKKPKSMDGFDDDDDNEGKDHNIKSLSKNPSELFSTERPKKKMDNLGDDRGS